MSDESYSEVAWAAREQKRIEVLEDLKQHDFYLNERGRADLIGIDDDAADRRARLAEVAGFVSHHYPLSNLEHFSGFLSGNPESGPPYLYELLATGERDDFQVATDLLMDEEWPHEPDGY